MLTSQTSANYVAGQVIIKKDINGVITGLTDDNGTDLNIPSLTGTTTPLPPGTPNGPHSIAATSSQSGTGTVGTMLASPTASDNLTKIMKVTAPADARAVTISYRCPTGLACGRLWICVQPLVGDQEAAAKLAVRGGEVFSLNGGESRSFGVTANDENLTYVYLVAEFASGTGYTDASVVVQWWTQGMANQITSEYNGQVLNKIVSPYLYIPFMKSGTTAGTVQRYSNVTGLSSDITLTGTENYSSRVPMLTVDGTTYLADRTAAMADFTRLDADSQMIIIANAYFSGLTGTQYVLSFGIGVATGQKYGGYGLASTSATVAKIKWQPNGDVSADLPGSSIPIAANTSIVFALLFDCRNNTIRSVANGIEYAPCAMIFPTDSTKSKYPMPSATVGAGFAGRSQSSGASNIMAANSAINRVFMLKRSASSEDINSKFLSIAQAAFAFPNELPNIFRGL